MLMNEPDDQPDVPSNPFESPQHGAASQRRKRLLLRRRQLPTPAELMTLAISIFAVLVLNNAAADRTVSTLSHVLAMCFGLLLAAIPLFVVRLKLRTRRGYTPGDWLWLASACTECVLLASNFVKQTWPLWHPSLRIAAMYCLFSAAYCIPLVLCVSLRWRLTSLVVVLWNLYSAVAYIFAPHLITPLNHTFAHGLAIGGVGVAVMIDWQSAIRNVWSHWCGVALFVVWMALPVVPDIWLLFG